MMRKTIAIALPVLAAVAIIAEPSLAQTTGCIPDIPSTCAKLPGPGVFPLIALGIAGAIALAKLRK